MVGVSLISKRAPCELDEPSALRGLVFHCEHGRTWSLWRRDRLVVEVAGLAPFKCV